jgi:Transglutaminase-like superfamily
MTRITLVLRAYFDLIAHDVFMSHHDFAALHRRVKGFPLRRTTPDSNAIETVTVALDLACCFYPKRVLCLQRSAVFVRLLRSYGIMAHMLIGAQKMPFKAHAWVEVDRQIINDRLASRENFLVLEEC